MLLSSTLKINLKQKDRTGNLSLDGIIILKRILKKGEMGKCEID